MASPVWLSAISTNPSRQSTPISSGFVAEAVRSSSMASLNRRVMYRVHPTRSPETARGSSSRARERRGEGKPETFHFLGFTHICGTNHQTGKFTVHRKTIGKRMAAKLKDIRAQLRGRMHEPIPE